MINRRSFIQRCFAGVAGVYAAFLPNKKELPEGFKAVEDYKGDVPSEFGTDKHTRWYQPQTEPLTEGMELPVMGWTKIYKARILNDAPVTVISGGTPEEMDKLYEALIKEFPEKA